MKNEIKKMLYREDPDAYLFEVRADGIVYTAKDLTFLIPLREVGEVIWKREMKAKLLIRWLQD